MTFRNIGPDAVAAATLAPAAFEPGLAPFNCWPPQQPWAAVVLVVANTSSTRPVTTDLVAGDRRSGPMCDRLPSKNRHDLAADVSARRQRLSVDDLASTGSSLSGSR